eukprot:TRINITY_DN14001_c0_g1_i4.p1 TRINITY_DN14001_c0_g1~~TRINITY_DN14001_c0_g1_i4.p1  ORF type:complete len:299 (-),score=46.42 TRINITY_DN14001_c0_g1_i4:76-933(-)
MASGLTNRSGLSEDELQLVRVFLETLQLREENARSRDYALNKMAVFLRTLQLREENALAREASARSRDYALNKMADMLHRSCSINIANAKEDAVFLEGSVHALPSYLPGPVDTTATGYYLWFLAALVLLALGLLGAGKLLRKICNFARAGEAPSANDLFDPTAAFVPVTFKLHDGSSMYFDPRILMARSTFFKSMLTAAFRESSDHVVDLRNDAAVDRKTLEHLLCFIHFAELNLNDASSLLKLADKYEVRDLCDGLNSQWKAVRRRVRVGRGARRRARARPGRM